MKKIAGAGKLPCRLPSPANKKNIDNFHEVPRT